MSEKGLQAMRFASMPLFFGNAIHPNQDIVLVLFHSQEQF